MTLIQRRRALMGAGEKEGDIPGTIITVPQSCTEADQAHTIWRSIVSNNTKAGFYFTTKKISEWRPKEIVCVLLNLYGNVLTLKRFHFGSIQGVPNNANYDAVMTQGDTFYYVEAET